ncbi:mfs monosaccharide [Lasallia pustulata]|uniref:Mfs monosaccharide n=1 Tax=Lasallia pustulata TaxID=136370 RepID=A0A1W5D7W7_9LECA|nr:mfs monosaccharide [Lasallia pustulata]
MAFLSRFKRQQAPVSPESEDGKGYNDNPVRFLTLRSGLMGVLASMGGFIFGYDTGQISGFLAMSDFLRRFSKDGKKFSNVRSGLIVGLLSIGTLAGALIMAPVADRIGRRYSVTLWSLVFMVGVVIQIASTTVWQQIAVGRLIAGAGVGALSILVPLYVSESGPRQVRGALVSTYQLFITLGIFTADCINFGTEARPNSGAWRIPMGVGFIWPMILGLGILCFPESPRHAFRKGRYEEARTTMARFYGVHGNHREIHREMREIKEKNDEEIAGGQQPWYKIFTGPRMGYRTLLGITLQALQQLTGANFFFYYGTTIFTATGISNSYVTAMILGGVNFGMTFFGLYIVEHFGRRKSLIIGGIGMTTTFLVFASVGSFSLDNADPMSTPKAGAAMIVFACLFIAFYATTWGPIIWCIIGELYPTRYRARSMALATSSNWLWNFLIAFFTPFITAKIGFRYGYVFAGCNFAAVLIVYFFVCETQGRSLEEIDTMYISHVPPWKSSKWEPPAYEDLMASQRMAQGGNTNGGNGVNGRHKESNDVGESRLESV